jgi:hypothetical protein
MEVRRLPFPFLFLFPDKDIEDRPVANVANGNDDENRCVAVYLSNTAMVTTDSASSRSNHAQRNTELTVAAFEFQILANSSTLQREGSNRTTTTITTTASGHFPANRTKG